MTTTRTPTASHRRDARAACHWAAAGPNAKGGAHESTTTDVVWSDDHAAGGGCRECEQPQPQPQPPQRPASQPQSQVGTEQPRQQPTARPAQPRTPTAQSATAAERAARITRLGTSDAIYRRMRTLDDVKRMAADRNAQRRLSTAMDAAGLTGLTSEVMSVLSNADAQRMTEVRIEPGTRMEWMAFRQGSRGRIQRPAIWAGRQPFEAWRFTIESGGTRYNFLLPKVARTWHSKVRRSSRCRRRRLTTLPSG